MNLSIILAAGAGTRMVSKKPKVVHEIAGRPILDYVISASEGGGIEKNIVIVGHGAEEIKEYFKETSLIFEEQPIGDDAPYGTGYAVMQAKDHIEDESTVVILCGDTPLIREETVAELLDFHKEGKYDGTVLTAVLEESSGYGRIVRDKSGHIEKIVEERDASQEEKEIKEVNSGVYTFNGKLLKEALDQIDDNNAQGEFYITDVVGILRDKGCRLGACIIDDPVEISGVNSRIQLADCDRVIRKRINKRHMENGVTLIDPENTYIGESVEIGQDTTIYPNVYIEGSSKIGEDCIIRSSTRIIDSRLGNGLSIESSLIEESEISNNTKIGPNAHLRPKCKIGANVNIGNFVEVKNARMGDNSKAGHLSYIGDAEVGSNVNIGSGVVFANYDGANKFESIIGDDSFIGSNSTLVAPVEIECEGYVAAGSTITDKVHTKELAIARGRQVNKENWRK